MIPVTAVNTLRGNLATAHVYLAAMTLGQRIAAARSAREWNQSRLAAECGWRWGSRIGNYEQGLNEPSLQDLRAIADATGVRFSWLTTGEGPMMATAVAEAPPSYTSLSPDERALLEKYRQASSEGKRVLQASATAISEPAQGEGEAPQLKSG